MTKSAILEAFNESKKYWEPKRKWYLLFLAIITTVGIMVISEIGHGIGDRMETNNLVIISELLIAFIFANIAYSFAYIPDILVQFTPLKGFWNYYRLLVFVVGCIISISPVGLTLNQILHISN